MTPTTITRQQAIPLILAAIEDGTLAATHPGGAAAYAWPQVGTEGMVNSQACRLIKAGEPVCYCAIGVLVGHDNAMALQFDAGTHYAFASKLIHRGDLIVPADEKDWFIHLQSKHDAWVSASSKVRETRRQEFMDHLQ